MFINLIKTRWRCNFANNYVCTCQDIFTEEKSCRDIGNAVGFNDTHSCKRCTYASNGQNQVEESDSEGNSVLQLNPIDCDSSDLNITSYICQKRYLFI